MESAGARGWRGSFRRRIAGGLVAGLESAAVRVAPGPAGGAASGGLALAAGVGRRIAVANVAADGSGRRGLFVLRG